MHAMKMFTSMIIRIFVIDAEKYDTFVTHLRGDAIQGSQGHCVEVNDLLITHLCPMQRSALEGFPVIPNKLQLLLQCLIGSLSLHDNLLHKEVKYEYATVI